jgi:hypothetical protein
LGEPLTDAEAMYAGDHYVGARGRGLLHGSGEPPRYGQDAQGLSAGWGITRAARGGVVAIEMSSPIGELHRGGTPVAKLFRDISPSSPRAATVPNGKPRVATSQRLST